MSGAWWTLFYRVLIDSIEVVIDTIAIAITVENLLCCVNGGSRRKMRCLPMRRIGGFRVQGHSSGFRIATPCCIRF